MTSFIKKSIFSTQQVSLLLHAMKYTDDHNITPVLQNFFGLEKNILIK